MLRGVIDRDRSTLADAEQREALEAGGVDHGTEVLRPGFGGGVVEGAIREAGARRS